MKPIAEVLVQPDLFMPETHQVSVRATTRTVKGPPPPDGFHAKHAALIALEGKARTHEAVLWVRERLKELYFTRLALGTAPHDTALAFVTADDAYNLLRAHPIFAGTLDGPQQWRASIFRTGFRDTKRMVPSLRIGQKASKITAWEL